MYEQLSNAEYDFRQLSEADQETLLSKFNSQRVTESPEWLWISRCAIVMIIFSILGLTAMVILWMTTRSVANAGPFCTHYVSQYSPILEEMPLSYELVKFNGSLLKENAFRQSAGLEVDAAWAALGVNYRAVIVPANQAERSGLEPDQVKISQKYGGGFPANVEGLHHLHCLNLVRQSLYYNYDYYHSRGEGAFRNEDHIVQHHISHCLDIIRQQLMCAIDIGMLGQVWINTSAPEAFVDFNTKHKCRDFEAVRIWAEERQMPEVVPNDWLEPPKYSDRVYEEIP